MRSLEAVRVSTPGDAAVRALVAAAAADDDDDDDDAAVVEGVPGAASASAPAPLMELAAAAALLSLSAPVLLAPAAVIPPDLQCNGRGLIIRYRVGAQH